MPLSCGNQPKNHICSSKGRLGRSWKSNSTFSLYLPILPSLVSGLLFLLLIVPLEIPSLTLLEAFRINPTQLHLNPTNLHLNNLPHGTNHHL